ncbi:MAG: type VI secretion system ATPase TssH, partial [Firmicutes bacterium]|nr:type VI secretion system ATPase TssH [Bacillota bacterium]
MMENYTQKALAALQQAQAMASENRNPQVCPEHLFYALADQDGGLIENLLHKMGVDVDALLARLDKAIDAFPRLSQSEQSYASRELEKVLRQAEKNAKQEGDEYLSVEQLMLALFDSTAAISDICRELNIDRDAFRRELARVKTGQVTSDDPENTYDALNKYGSDLVERAREHKLDPVIGRDQEIRSVIR